jgi:hypothetical protein
MLTNKYLQAGLSAGVALFGWASAFDWTSITSAKTSAAIAGGIGAVKLVLNALAPAPKTLLQPTGGLLITHKEV